MTFLAAHWLWLLVAVAALGLAHLVIGLRRPGYAARLSARPLLDVVLPRRPGWWRRHVPAVLLLLTLTSGVIALARPARVARVPRAETTVMVAIDVSNSMASTDVAPDRLRGAEAGALAFLNRLPPPVDVGLVAFSGAASVLVAPTTDRDAVRRAIRGLRLGPETAIGDAILACLRSIATFTGPDRPAATAPTAAIVLLSDGETTSGTSNDAAVAAARRARVPVDTIAFGTPTGTLDIAGMDVPVPVNGTALRAIAGGTGGTYHRVTSGDELRDVYNRLGDTIGYQVVHREWTTWFIGLAIALGLTAATAVTIAQSTRSR